MMYFISCQFVLGANVLASAFLFAYALLALNRMGKGTCHRVRAWYVALAVGAAGVLLAPLFDHARPQFWETVSNIGTAGLLWDIWMSQRRALAVAARGEKP